VKNSAFLFILFVFSCNPVLAQILNIEKERQSADSTGRFFGSAEFTFELNNRSITENDQNNFLQLGVESNFGYASEEHVYLLINDFDYTSFSNESLIRTGYIHGRINWLWQNPLSFETFGQLQFDLGRGLDSRWLAGGGLRKRLIKSEKVTLNFGLGAMYEREEWQDPLTEMVVELALLKSTNYLAWNWKISDDALLSLNGYFQTGYDGEAEVFRNRYASEVVLSFKLSRFIIFTTDFNFFYEDKPVVPIRKYFYTLENGVKFSF
jgi:hypothetical protein